MKRPLSLVVGWLAVALAALATTPVPDAAAQVPEVCVAEFAEDAAGYRFGRCDVPDFDQERDDVTGGGEAYCVPTAAADWLVYLIRRGATDIVPGPDMIDADDRISQLINALGTRMSTHATNGTTRQGLVAGLARWFDESYDGRGGDYFVLRSHDGELTIDGFDVRVVHPTGDDLVAAGAAGSLVVAHVGWYDHNGAEYRRVGGHGVAMTRGRPVRGGEGNPGDYVLGFNDPSDRDDDPTAQGPMSTDPHVAGAVSTDILAEGATRRMDKLFGAGYSSGWLEGMTLVTPKFALFPDPEPDDEADLRRRFAFPLDEHPTAWTADGIDGEVIDLALHPTGVHHRAVLDDGRLVAINEITGAATTLATYPGVTDLVIDDQLRTALLDSDGRITVLDRHGNPAWDVSIPGATDIAYSSRLRSLVTWDGDDRELVVLGSLIPGNPVQPRRLPLGPEGPPIAALSINPTTGTIGLLEPGTNDLTRVDVSEGRFTTVHELSLGDGAPLSGLVADATGTWYSTSGGRMVAFDASGAPLPDNPFAGQPSTPAFAIVQPAAIGEPIEGPDVMPQDAPQGGVELTATPAAAIAELGTSHTVTVRLLDDTGGPLAGETVHYDVTGANPTTGTTTTDATGAAVIEWTGIATGDDTLVTWAEPNGRAIARVTWVAPAPVATTLTLAASANPAIAGRPVTITATVTNSDPAAAAPTGTVTFTDRGVPIGGPVTVDASGRARVTVTWRDAGVRSIDAAFEPAAGSRLLPSNAHLDVHVRCGLLDLGCLLRSLLGAILRG